MQANCPQCGQRITVDDARVPDKPFGVRCPKCAATVRFPGRAPAAEAAPPAAAPPAPAPSRPETAPVPLPPVPVEAPRPVDSLPRSEERALAAHARREAGDAAGRALVALPDPNAAAAAALLLSRQGFSVDTLEDPSESLRLLEQGLYVALCTARVASASPRGETLYQRACRLSPDARRRLFLLLVGDEFRSGDTTQAFAAQADLVLRANDAGHADALLRAALDERQRLYHAFLDARRRAEAVSG